MDAITEQQSAKPTPTEDGTVQVKREPSLHCNSQNVPALNPSTEIATEATPIPGAAIPTNAVRIKSEPGQQLIEIPQECAAAENVATTVTPANGGATTIDSSINVKQENNSAGSAIESTNTSEVSGNNVAIADNFFNDLIEENCEENIATEEAASDMTNQGNSANTANSTRTRVNVKQEIAQGSEVDTTEVPTNTADVNINDDFFSDLIEEPPLPPPLETLPVEELEEKFSVRLRELQALDNEDTASENQVQSQTLQQSDRGKKRQLSDNEQNDVDKRPRVGLIRLASVTSLFEKPTTSSPIPSIRVKSEFDKSTDNNATLECLPVIHYNSQQSSNSRTSANKTSVDLSRVKCENVFSEIEDFGDGIEMSPKLKREMALKRVAATKELFKKHAKGLGEILHTDTVRKLPSNASYMTQQFYDNRSPLHTTNNVQFKFNSPYTDIKLKDWGLEPLSTVTAHVARVIGFDAYVLNFKLEITEISKYLPGQRLNGIDKNVELSETGSSIFLDATTQTALIGPVFSKPPKKDTNTVPTQTEGAATDVQGIATCLPARVQSFPFLKKLDKLNENQLLALNDFAELMEQQDIAADVYRLRECLLQIFHRSQLQPIVNQATMYMQQQPQAPIQQMPNQMFLQQSNPPPPPTFNHSIANNHAQYELNNRNFVPSPHHPQQQMQIHNYTATTHRRAPQMELQQLHIHSSTRIPRNARNDPRIQKNQRGRI